MYPLLFTFLFLAVSVTVPEATGMGLVSLRMYYVEVEPKVNIYALGALLLFS
jgi:hypothetical protein